MTLYRLKKEAVPFFHEKHAIAIKDFEDWKNLGVDPKALDVVEEAVVTYGHKVSDNSTSLSGWDEDGAHFLFTIRFPSVKFSEYDKFKNGKIVRELMDKIQREISHFYSEFEIPENAFRV